MTSSVNSSQSLLETDAASLTAVPHPHLTYGPAVDRSSVHPAPAGNLAFLQTWSSLSLPVENDVRPTVFTKLLMNMNYSWPMGMNFTGGAAYVSPFDLLHVKIVIIVFYSLVFIACFFGNLIVIVVILRHERLRSATSFFLANLAGADLMVGVFCVLPALGEFLSPEWHLGRTMCKLYHFVRQASYTASVFILTAIAVERYLVIVHPLSTKSVSSITRLRIVVAVLWVASGVYGIPQLLLYEEIALNLTGTTHRYCGSFGSQFNIPVYVMVNFLLLYACPFVIIGTLYCRICVTLRRSNSACVVKTRYRCQRIQSDAADSSCLIKNRSESVPAIAETPLTAEVLRADQKLSCCSPCNIALTSRSRNGSLYSACKHNATKNNQRKTFKFSTSSSYNSSSCSQDGFRTRSFRWSRTSTQSESLNEPSRGRLRSVFGVRVSCRNHRTIQARQRVIKLLCVVVLTFALLVLPYHIRVLYQFWKPVGMEGPGELLSTISFIILFLNSAVNPVLYALLSENFRTCMLEVVLCSANRRRKVCRLFSSRESIRRR